MPDSGPPGSDRIDRGRGAHGFGGRGFPREPAPSRKCLAIRTGTEPHPWNAPELRYLSGAGQPRGGYDRS